MVHREEPASLVGQAIGAVLSAHGQQLARSAGQPIDGLSVAYHAKPAVRAQAKVAINQGGLDRLLEVLR